MPKVKEQCPNPTLHQLHRREPGSHLSYLGFRLLGGNWACLLRLGLCLGGLGGEDGADGWLAWGWAGWAGRGGLANSSVNGLDPALDIVVVTPLHEVRPPSGGHDAKHILAPLVVGPGLDLLDSAEENFTLPLLEVVLGVVGQLVPFHDKVALLPVQDLGSLLEHVSLLSDTSSHLGRTRKMTERKSQGRGRERRKMPFGGGPEVASQEVPEMFFNQIQFKYL